MGRIQLLAGVAAAVAGFYLGVTILLLPVAFLIGYAASGGYAFLRAAVKTFPRDCYVLKNLWHIEDRLKKYDKERKGIQAIFQETAKKHGDRTAILFEEQRWTYADLDGYANQIGHCFLNLGRKPGDTVALFMVNKPEFVASWIGMARIGVVSSLINTNLRKESLLHCVTVCKAKALVFGMEMKDAVMQIKDELEANQVQLFVIGEHGSPIPRPSELPGLNVIILNKSIEAQTKSAAQDALPEGDPGNDMGDMLFYIYTSGTTGLPKPCKITHRRFFIMAYALGLYNGYNQDTVMYCPLPLYHTNGAILATGAIVFFGGTLALSRKFSASAYWETCIKHKATAMIYIGEICRYLLSQPAKDTDDKHTVSVACGNGLKKKLWVDFQARFKVKKIVEFYGATESNANMANITGKVGAVGFNSIIYPSIYPIFLIRVNMETNEPIRDSNGLCMRCEVGEPGEIVGKIVDTNPLRRFEGYADPAASRMKVMHNVLKKDDKYFRSGDILVQDEEGYYYFQDRTGDTFRWKGENVSTQEVEGHVQRLLGLRDVIVYGVEVPGTDGRAGMAAIVATGDSTDGGVDLDDLHSRIKETVPAYAAPVFIRIIQEAELTGTFKLKKVALARAGFALNEVGDDPIFIALPGRAGYKRLERGELYDKLVGGQLRL